MSSLDVRTTRPGLTLQALQGIKALDPGSDLGSMDLVDGPLHDLLFGADEQTYAILDGAAVPGLPEFLEQSGLEHRCLFVGKALEDFGDLAPWLVKLSNGSDLTRNLFTDSDAPWHLWRRSPGMCVQSPAGFTEIWQHLRRFTRLYNSQDNAFFWRFWEPRYWRALVDISDSSWAQGWPLAFCGPFSTLIFVIEGDLHQLDCGDACPIGRIDPQQPISVRNVDMMQAVMMRRALAPLCRELPRDAWIVPYLLPLFENKNLSDDTISALMRLKVGAGTQVMCKGLISNRALPPAHLAQALTYLLAVGGP